MKPDVDIATRFDLAFGRLAARPAMFVLEMTPSGCFWYLSGVWTGLCEATPGNVQEPRLPIVLQWDFSVWLANTSEFSGRYLERFALPPDEEPWWWRARRRPALEGSSVGTPLALTVQEAREFLSLVGDARDSWCRSHRDASK